MSEARLLINSDKELALEGEVFSIGRASDNDVAFPEDSNVSRYHAEIEKRGEDEFWIIDLNSSNGTAVNGEKINGEKPLSDGDSIIFGGTSEVKILLSPREEEKEEEEESEEESSDETLEKPEDENAEVSPTPTKSKLPLLFIFAGLFVGLAVLSVATAGIIYFTRNGGTTSQCQAQAKISNPRNGEFVKKETNIEIELQDGGCVKRVIFMLDGQPFAESSEAPFSVSFDPAKFPEYASDGLDHKISLLLEDENGNKIQSPTEVALAIETAKTKKPNPDETPIDISNPSPPQPIDEDEPNDSSNMSIIELQKMTKNVLPQFAGKFEYQTNNQAFLQAVNAMTKDYASASGYFERARKYNETIAREFIQNRDLDPPLGYILAMSQTKFQPANQSDGAGLWKMSNDLVLESNYNGSCGTETIAEASQKCAAIASSTYLKDIIRDVFDGDIIYGIAAFGMSKNQAEAWRDSLPPPEQRKDFWNVIKSKEQKELVVRFFAAATVAENPQKFGLTNDKPLSQLYRLYMK